jgi:hypothetical protein
MTEFLNIYDLAEKVGISDLEISKLKKAKKRILAEVELDDNQMKIKNSTLTKSDILNLFDEIEKDNQVLRFQKVIFQNSYLNNFLYGIDNSFSKKLFENPTNSNSIKEFINYLSPYFAKQFKKVYKNAFENGNVFRLKFKPPISSEFLEEIYSPVQKILENFENELTLSNVVSKVNNNFIEKINALPDYFSKSRDDIALKVRSLSVDAWNKNENLDLAFKILDIAFKFKVSIKVTQKIKEDKKGLEDLKEKKRENEKVEGFFELINKAEEIKKYSANPLRIYNSLAPKIRKLDYYKAKEVFVATLTSDDNLDYYQKANIRENTTTDFIKNMLFDILEKMADSCRDVHSDYSTATKFDDLVYEVKYGRKKSSYSSSSTTTTNNYSSSSSSSSSDGDSFWGWIFIIGTILYFIFKD